ncbi:MAG TPA: YfiR/HmsC family protein [Bacteroidales bacterium]|nr:YfiR/HmsC family protein [Bacteroidales bacterium]
MKKFLAYLCLLLGCLIAVQVNCNAQVERDIAISAYIYNFAKNVEWQNENEIKEFHFHVLGDDKSIIKELIKLSESKKLRKKTIKVTSSSLLLKDYNGVHLIFVTKGNEDKLEKVYDKIQGKNILLVSDSYKNPGLIMINFYDSQEGNLRFEINKGNIINHNLSIKPDMILLGGSIVDVAALYEEGQQSLRALQIEIGTLNSNRALLEKNLDTRAKEIELKRDSIRQQTLKIQEQYVILDEQLQLINKQKNDLQEQVRKIDLQQQIYNRQSGELKAQKTEIEKGNKLIQDHKNAINRQKAEIAQQKTDILSQSLILTRKEAKLQRQRYFLILLGGISALIAGTLLSIFYAYRNKKKLNKELEKRVLDRTIDLKEANKKLQRELAERKLAEESLYKSEERFRLTLDNMLEGGQIIGFDMRYLYVNDTVASQGKKSKDELLGHKMTEVYPGIENTAVFPVIKKCMKDRTIEHLVNEFYYEDGSSRFFELSVQPVPEGVFILSFDITERHVFENKIKRLNEELEEKVNLRTIQLENANQELEAFAYSVSHDLRAPLRAINGFTKILSEDYSEKIDAEGHRICGIIQNEAARMGQLIDDLLAFSRLSRSPMQTRPADMTALVKNVFEETKEQYPDNKVEFSLTPLLTADVDVNLLRQVWINYISNAFKFSSKKEIIKIQVGCYENPRENIYFVKDNGAGFDMKYADKLFGVFQRLHNINEFYGTGVGLAIVQRIIHRHGGRVWAEGEINKGATFYFSLPINK